MGMSDGDAKVHDALKKLERGLKSEYDTSGRSEAV